MGIEDLENFPKGEEGSPAASENGAEQTGRIQTSRPAVSVPSIISSGKPKTIQSKSIPSIAPNPSQPNSRSSASVPKVSMRTSSSLGESVTGNMGSRQGGLGDEQADTGKIEGFSEQNTGSLQAAPQSSHPSPALSSPATSDSFSIDSADLDPLTKKGIEVRKEQIQRAQKRAVTQKRKRIIKIVRRAVIAIIIILAIAVTGTFSVFRWGIFDDYADMQGTWRINDTKATIKIEDGKIQLNKEVIYDFSIDPNSKTLTFDFGQLDGNARYRFSVDRNQLSLLDGEFNTTDTLTDDIPWTFQALWDFIATSDIKDPGLGEGSITLNRVTEE